MTTRREFLQLMAASMAMAALSGCAPIKAEHIVPLVNDSLYDPAEVFHYTTAMDLGGVLVPAVGRCTGGRPIKLDGNPTHAATRGRSDPLLQGVLLSLYDPDRSQTVLHNGQPATWTEFDIALDSALASGRGLHLLTEPTSSPTLLRQIQAMQRKYPEAQWHSWDPLSEVNTAAGVVQAFGRPLALRYHLDRADCIVSLDHDFLGSGQGRIRYAADFAAHRVVRRGTSAMSRLHALYRTPTLTSANADFRIPLSSLRLQRMAVALLEQQSTDPDIMRIRADLQAARGRSLVLVGESQPPWMHALGHYLNGQFGNIGQTVTLAEPVLQQGQSLADLITAIAAARVTTLVMLGGNPVHTCPGFEQALTRVPFRAHLSLYDDETSHLCTWHLPAAHFLEAWTDGRAYDGTVSIVQPLIEPLYGGRSPHEVMAALAGADSRTGYEQVRQTWQTRLDEPAWRQALHDGFLAGSTPPDVAVNWPGQFVPPPLPGPTPQLEIAFVADPYLLDGRHANNGWLQELPRPLTELTWDNVVCIGPGMGLQTGDKVTVRVGDRQAVAPVWVLPGQPADVATVTLGFGRTRAGNLGTGTGTDFFPLRTPAGWWGAPGTLVPLGTRTSLATTQRQHDMAGRPVKYLTLADFMRHPQVADEELEPPSLYPRFQYEGYAWGMVIDLTACIGCKACTIACQAENNIPVVGRDQVLRGRAMHWMRVDTYEDERHTFFEPVACMHCEDAPCELVCPVGATVHSSEGLNDMVYNRCVGTRYCSNNCPYKVRRFNFLQYSPLDEPAEELVFNPDVSVRPRGVMEKCTYCVQRINAARMTAEKEDRLIADGDIVTACQQACPTGAIIFGNINDPQSQVARLRQEPHLYGLLAELDARPRTTYLARIGNGEA